MVRCVERWSEGLHRSQLDDDGILRYGWVALTMDTAQSRLIVHGGAYRIDPDEPIIAGQTD